MGQRERRVGENEALFRDVNERIVELDQTLGVGAGNLRFVCECAELGCAEPLLLTESEYERVRADPTTFMVFLDHVIADVEDVIEQNDRFTIVRKREPEAARIAVLEDPRA